MDVWSVGGKVEVGRWGDREVERRGSGKVGAWSPEKDVRHVKHHLHNVLSPDCSFKRDVIN